MQSDYSDLCCCRKKGRLATFKPTSLCSGHGVCKGKPWGFMHVKHKAMRYLLDRIQRHWVATGD